jgi:predicted aminopeptidase
VALRRRIALGCGGVLALIALAIGATATGRYLIRAGWEEAKILRRRRPISAIIADPTTSAMVRGKLRLVLDARTFAMDSLHFPARESFTTYSTLDRDTLVLVLSGAYRDKLAAYTWWFPIVGRVPYKGYFNFDLARKAQRDLAARGFDASLRPAAAFSTLGFFNDPLLPTTLREDSVDLANTVIHELTHNSFYAPGQATFNESFANFVGGRGAEAFFRERGDLKRAQTAALRWEDDKVLAEFYSRLYDVLDSAFKAHPKDRAWRLAVRDTVFRAARIRLVDSVGPRLRAFPRAALPRVRLDNAVVLSRRVYLTDLDLFDLVYDRQRRSVRDATAVVTAVARAKPHDPYRAVVDWLSKDPLLLVGDTPVTRWIARHPAGDRNAAQSAAKTAAK